MHPPEENIMSRTILRAALIGAATLSFITALPVSAQTFPNKILRVVNPNAPGGNSDVLFRLLAPKMG
jgi:tripartite-type tricarboxylate transporter receptor subunit TctC